MNLENRVDNPTSEPENAPQKPFPYYLNVTKILKKIGLNIEILNNSTPFCKHAHGCLNNILSGTLQSFVIGYIIKTTINIISVLLGLKKLIRQ